MPHHQRSGLRQATTMLEGVEGIGIVTLTTEDVVRHRLVKEIIKAYEKVEAEERARREARKAAEAEHQANEQDKRYPERNLSQPTERD